MNKDIGKGAVVVHIWSFQGSTRAWGHASMSVFHNKDDYHQGAEADIYISWWPNNDDYDGEVEKPNTVRRKAKKPIVGNYLQTLKGQIYRVNAHRQRSFLQDCMDEREIIVNSNGESVYASQKPKKPDHEVVIGDINTNNIQKYWHDLNNQDSPQWRTVKQNCSTVVAKALECGLEGITCKARKSWTSSVIWSPNAVLSYARSIEANIEAPEVAGW